MCGERRDCHHGRHHAHHHGDCCGHGGAMHFGAHFASKEEKTAWLEKYLASLNEELAAVKGRIAALKGDE